MFIEKINCNFNYILLVCGVLIMVTTFAVPRQKEPLKMIPFDNKTTERPWRRQQNHFDMQHFEQSTDLDHYMNNIDLLLEPSSCGIFKRIVTMVTSRASNVEARQAIRNTWGKLVGPFFLLGVEDYFNAGDKLPDYILEEAKQYNDIVVYNVWEHYQNLTIKTMLMIKWTLSRCHKIDFFFKTDDDVFVQPWVLDKVAKDNKNNDVIGRKYILHALDRTGNGTCKHYVPEWMETLTVIPEYLDGTGYMINGKHLSAIYETARSVPLMNLEDVYVTYLVAKRGLGLNLTNDYRMNAYGKYVMKRAVTHCISPEGTYVAWKCIMKKVKRKPAQLDVLGWF